MQRLEETGGQSLAPHQVEPHPYRPLLAEMLPGDVITVPSSDEEADTEEILDYLDFFREWKENLGI